MSGAEATTARGCKLHQLVPRSASSVNDNRNGAKMCWWVYGLYEALLCHNVVAMQ
jgi:hypothetical protein